MTLGESTITEYLNYCRYQKNLDEKTLKAYGIDLRQYYTYIQDFCGDGTTREDVSNYLVYLHGQFKAKTAKRKIASLKAFFFFCEEEGHIIENPFLRLKIKYKEPHTLPKTIPMDTLQKVLKTAYADGGNVQSSYRRKTQLRDIAILETLFATGARVSELCSLSHGDLNLEDSTIRIMGKGSKERIIQITNVSVRNAIKCYLATTNCSVDLEAPIFLNRNGKRITEQSVRCIINKYVKVAGISAHLTPHMFRHTFATMLLEEDVDIRYIQQLLGHSTISTTQIYTHVSSKKQRTILELKHPRNRLVI